MHISSYPYRYGLPGESALSSPERADNTQTSAEPGDFIFWANGWPIV